MINVKNAAEYIENFLKIRTKDGAVVDFKLNAPQKKLYSVIREEHKAGRPIRIIILKARQMGFSTLTEGLLFHGSATNENISSMIVAHREDATANLFRMSKLFYEELPEQIKPMRSASNAQELVFDNPTRDAKEKEARPGLRSRIRCVTAGGKGAGRSDTIQNLHVSEYAFWTGDKRSTLLGLLQAVPNLPGTMVIIESTANGFEDFKTRWDAASRGESDYVPVFFAWHEMEEYRMPVPPGTVWTEKEIELKERYSLDDEQLAWRRWCIRNNCGGDELLFAQEYPASADEAFLTSGNPVFNNAEIAKRRERPIKPIACGEFEYDYDGIRISNIRFVENERGAVKIYKQPTQGTPYVLGGDTAGEGSDYFTGQMLDNTDGSQVAVLRQQYDEVIYAHQIYCMGMYYNTALIGIENNYSTYATRELERLKYPKLYVRETEDSYTHKLKESFGFMTTPTTRPVIIANLAAVMLDGLQLVNDMDTLGEMLVFCYNEHRRPEALEGENDDLVMALAIAHYIRPQQSYMATKDEVMVTWSESMWEDYENATPEERAYLIKKWGKPKK